MCVCFFFSSRRRHTRLQGDWSSDVCSSDLTGFMGDGINDAPALRAADIGISVDSAVDIAKEAADIILLEKSLMVLEQGVIEGRRTFSNMLKYIRMTASSKIGRASCRERV